MGASPSQFDHVPGFDLSSVASASQEQVMQALRQLGPLSNIGGIIVMSGGGGTDWPGITNNPRFIRYIWIDTYTNPPTVKIHDQSGDTYADWISFTVAANSVTDASVAAGAAIAITKLAYGTARYLVRTNAGASALEFVNPNAIFNASELPRSAIDVSGAPAGTSFLRRDASGGVTAWAKPSFADIDTASLLGIDRINPSGTNNQVLATIAGANVWDEIQDILVDGTLPINKLVSGTAYQVLRRNGGGSSNEWGALPFNRYEAVEDSQNLDLSLPLGADTVYNINHTLGVRPLLVSPVLVCKVVDLAYAVGDEIPLDQVTDNTAANGAGRHAFGVLWTSAIVKFWGQNIAANRVTYTKNTGALANITNSSWRLKFYAYA